MIQNLLYALAEGWEQGTLPSILEGITTRKAVEWLMRRDMPQGRADWRTLRTALDAARGKKGIADIRPTIEGIINRHEPDWDAARLYGMDEVRAVDTLKKLAPDVYWPGWDYSDYRSMLQAGITHEDEFARAHQALMDLAKPVDPAIREARETARLEREVMLLKIPGFFPTPQPLVDRMVQIAGITSGMRVLEPGAGSGRIADAVRAAGASVECVEVSPSLYEILKRRMHRVIGFDFDELPEREDYDAVIMNPPFEHLTDARHVRKAYNHLKPGGRLVSIMGEGAFINGNSTGQAFRAWLDEVGADVEQLPEGTFKESGTNVATRLVVIDK